MDDKKRRRALTDADRSIIRKRNQEHPSGTTRKSFLQKTALNWSTELRDQIAQLPIERLLPLDKFLNLEDETIVDKDGDIFAAVVECYSVDQPDEEEESSDKEEVKQIKDAEALRMVERLKVWKL